MTDELDHHNINDLPAFQDVETSAENQAKYIFEELKKRTNAFPEQLLYVKVWETPNQWAMYSERTLFV